MTGSFQAGAGWAWRPDQSGSVTVFAAFIVVPLLLVLLSLSLDLNKYYAEMERVQRALDESVLQAHRFLPYQDQARSVLQANLRERGELHSGTELQVTNEMVSAKVERMSPLIFARMFGIEVGIPISAFSMAWATPFDAFIAIDRASYLGPDPLSGQAWGDAAEWPAARYFDRLMPLFDEHGTALDPRLVTQQCFNPAYSALKSAAVEAYDYLSASRLNTVGIGAFPGSFSALEVSRPVAVAGPVGGDSGEATFPLMTQSLYSSSVWCAAAAQEEYDHAVYQFPRRRPSIEAPWQVPDHLERIVSPPDSWDPAWRLNADYQPYLSAREVLWSHAVSSAAPVSMTELLRDVRAALFAAPYLDARRGLRNRPVKQAYILAGDVPWIGGQRFPDGNTDGLLRAELAQWRSFAGQAQTALNLHLLIPRHPGNEVEFDQRTDALAALLKQESSDYFKPRVYPAHEPERAGESLVAAVVLSGRSGVLVR